MSESEASAMLAEVGDDKETRPIIKFWAGKTKATPQRDEQFAPIRNGDIDGDGVQNSEVDIVYSLNSFHN